MFHKRPNASLRPRWTLPDSAGLPPGLYATYISIYNEPHSSHQHDCSVQRVRADKLLGTQITPNSARSHYNINSVTPIYLIIMNSASLSYNSTYVRANTPPPPPPSLRQSPDPSARTLEPPSSTPTGFPSYTRTSLCTSIMS